MSIVNYLPYEFSVQGINKKLTLLSFRGEQEISSLFEFEVEFACDDKNLDFTSFMLRQATIKISSATTEQSYSYISGICVSITASGVSFDSYLYSVKIAPNLQKCGFNRYSRIYQQKSIKEIIEYILNENSITQYQIKFAESCLTLPQEYICQYNESDLNFISRWMEQVGAYYYFEFTNGVDKLIITDSKISEQKLSPDTYDFSDANELVEGERISELRLTYKAIPGSYQLKNYDAEFNNMTLDKTSQITSKSSFIYYEYGGNAKLQKICPKLSEIESQRLRVDGVEAKGEGSVRQFNPGFLFTMRNHPQTKNNGQYLITKLRVEAEQSSFSNQNSKEPMYKNYFYLIPADVQFRPTLKAIKPIFSGVLSASIDAEGVNTPLLDQYGRYKVKMPFDDSNPNPAKASCWIRMMQPSAASSNRGFHISLLQGDEVLIGFMEGDIDRPVILGAINSREGVVTDANIMQDRFKSLGGHEMIFDNTPGKEIVYAASKDGGVQIYYGNIK